MKQNVLLQSSPQVRPRASIHSSPSSCEATPRPSLALHFISSKHISKARLLPATKSLNDTSPVGVKSPEMQTLLRKESHLRNTSPPTASFFTSPHRRAWTKPALGKPVARLLLSRPRVVRAQPLPGRNQGRLGHSLCSMKLGFIQEAMQLLHLRTLAEDF